MSTAHPLVHSLAVQLGHSLQAVSWRVATAESCTAGGIAEAITNVPGSSAWFVGGIVAYNNHTKQQLLGIESDLISQHGAVSEMTARKMAHGVLMQVRAEVSVAVTGIAGPSGGTPDKPVGSVWLAWSCHSNDTIAQLCHFKGNRNQVRRQTTIQALRGLLAMARREMR